MYKVVFLIGLCNLKDTFEARNQFLLVPTFLRQQLAGLWCEWSGEGICPPSLGIPTPEPHARSTCPVLLGSPGAHTIFCWMPGYLGWEIGKSLRDFCGACAGGDVYPPCNRACWVPAGTGTCPGEVLVSEPCVGVLRTPCHTRKGRISRGAFFLPSPNIFLMDRHHCLVYHVPCSD